MRQNYNLYVGKISPETDQKIEGMTRKRCALETRHITKEFLSAIEPPADYENAFSPPVVEARVEKLLELNKEYCGGVDTNLEKQIKEAADYQKSWFMNSEGGRKVLSGAEATRRAFKQKPTSPDLKL